MTSVELWRMSLHFSLQVALGGYFISAGVKFTGIVLQIHFCVKAKNGPFMEKGGGKAIFQKETARTL
jgi:hypothetical protein